MVSPTPTQGTRGAPAFLHPRSCSSTVLPAVLWDLSTGERQGGTGQSITALCSPTREQAPTPTGPCRIRQPLHPPQPRQGKDHSHTHTCIQTFPMGSVGPGSCCSADGGGIWLVTAHGMSSLIPSQYPQGAVQALSRRGEPTQGRGPPGAEDNSDAGTASSSFQLAVACSKMHAQGPQGQADMIRLWQPSKRNISPFHLTI